MNTYTLTFFGRKVGSIGITYHDVVEVRAVCRTDAIRKLYETHEHISRLEVSEHVNAKGGAK